MGKYIYIGKNADIKEIGLKKLDEVCPLLGLRKTSTQGDIWRQTSGKSAEKTQVYLQDMCPAGKGASAKAWGKYLFQTGLKMELVWSGDQQEGEWWVMMSGNVEQGGTWDFKKEGSLSFMWYSLHFINFSPRKTVNKYGSIPYFQVLVNTLEAVF